jgi:hypothetical protein
MVEVALTLILAVLLSSVAYYASKYTKAQEEAKAQRDEIAMKNRIIYAMKRVAESNKYLHEKLEKISEAKSALELGDLYNSLFK